MVITIARQHGSCGHDIARALAKALEINCYDKEIVDEAAANSEFSKELFDSYDEKRVSTYFAPVPHYMGMGEGMRLNMQVATIQFDTIRALADKGDCVFVGRCADYILRDRDDIVRVFIMGNMKDRVAEIMQRKGISEEKAKKLVREVDKDRSSYYRYYTDQIWGDAENYDICINSAKVGVDGAVAIIKAYIDSLK